LGSAADDLGRLCHAVRRRRVTWFHPAIPLPVVNRNQRYTVGQFVVICTRNDKVALSLTSHQAWINVPEGFQNVRRIAFRNVAHHPETLKEMEDTSSMEDRIAQPQIAGMATAEVCESL